MSRSPSRGVRVVAKDVHGPIEHLAEESTGSVRKGDAPRERSGVELPCSRVGAHHLAGVRVGQLMKIDTLSQVVVPHVLEEGHPLVACGDVSCGSRPRHGHRENELRRPAIGGTHQHLRRLLVEQVSVVDDDQDRLARLIACPAEGLEALIPAGVRRPEGHRAQDRSRSQHQRIPPRILREGGERASQIALAAAPGAEDEETPSLVQVPEETIRLPVVPDDRSFALCPHVSPFVRAPRHVSCDIQRNHRLLSSLRPCGPLAASFLLVSCHSSAGRERMAEACRRASSAMCTGSARWAIVD